MLRMPRIDFELREDVTRSDVLRSSEENSISTTLHSWTAFPAPEKISHPSWSLRACDRMASTRATLGPWPPTSCCIAN
jgi:hypothetical protein